MGKLAIK